MLIIMTPGCNRFLAVFYTPSPTYTSLRKPKLLNEVSLWWHKESKPCVFYHVEFERNPYVTLENFAD